MIAILLYLIVGCVLGIVCVIKNGATLSNEAHSLIYYLVCASTIIVLAPTALLLGIFWGKVKKK